jgi:hypothetical protein
MVMKTGKIDISKLTNPPLKSEFLTAKILAGRGVDIIFLEPNHAAGTKTPDILMNNRKWEIKCPKGDGKYTFQHAFKAAIKQSENIVFNLYRAPGNERNNIHKLEKLFDDSLSAKKMIIIKKSRQIIDF